MASSCHAQISALAGYDVCKILHMAMMLGEDSVRGKMEMEEFKIGFQEHIPAASRAHAAISVSTNYQ